MSGSHEIAFPPFRLEVSGGRLWRDRECLPIRQKTLAVLCYLIEHRDRVVGANELAHAIWPGRFGALAAPKQCILELRKLLGDSPREPTWIATVGRYGYRFIGSLATASDQPSKSARVESVASDEIHGHCVGRDNALARMQAAWEKADAGHPQLILLRGPSGIGKSAVAETFLRRIEPIHRGWIARGQCVDGQRDREAYLALLDALGLVARGRWRAPAIAVLERHAPLWLLQLPALIPPGAEPGLRQRVQSADRARMPRELTEALEALTRDHPGVLLLENLQWASGATLDWLNAWTLRRGPARLLAIGTWRTDDQAIGQATIPGVARMPIEWSRRPSVTTIPLSELDPGAVRTCLVSRFRDADLAAHILPVLYRRCGGHPLLIESLLDHWIGERQLARIDGNWQLDTDREALETGIPQSALDLIEDRLAGLEEAFRETLEVAGMIGMKFTTAQIAAVLDCDIDTQERRCAALAGPHGILAPAGLALDGEESVASRYAFRYALYREALCERSAPARRLLVQRRIERTRTDPAPAGSPIVGEIRAD